MIALINQDRRNRWGEGVIPTTPPYKFFSRCISPIPIRGQFGAKYLGFFYSRSLKTRVKYSSFAQLVLLSLYIFWEKCVYFSIFEWWNQVDSGWIGWETLTFWKKIDFQIGFLQTNFLLNSLDLKVTNAKISLDSQSEGVPMHANCQKVNKVQLPTFIFCW